MWSINRPYLWLIFAISISAQCLIRPSLIIATDFLPPIDEQRLRYVGIVYGSNSDRVATCFIVLVPDIRKPVIVMTFHSLEYLALDANLFAESSQIFEVEFPYLTHSRLDVS